MMSLSDNKQTDIIGAFNTTSIYFGRYVKHYSNRPRL